MAETVVATDREWLVWSNEHGAWWRDGGKGYTSHLDQAGRFTEAEADLHCTCRSRVPGQPDPEVKVFAPEYNRLRQSKPLEALRLRHGYSGADWIKISIGKTTISPFGETVAEILGWVWRGIYHMDHKALAKVDWGHARYLKVRIARGHDLATYDGRELTELVILCHDLCIRLSVTAEFGGWLTLHFSKREKRDGDLWDRHPTIEQAIKAVRTIEE